jgi:hypothetical protein
VGAGCSAQTVGGLSSQNQKYIVCMSMLFGYYHSEIWYLTRIGRYCKQREGHLQKYGPEQFYQKLDFIDFFDVESKIYYYILADKM